MILEPFLFYTHLGDLTREFFHVRSSNYNRTFAVPAKLKSSMNILSYGFRIIREWQTIIIFGNTSNRKEKNVQGNN